MFKCIQCFESFTQEEVWDNEEAGNRGCPCCEGELEGGLTSHKLQKRRMRFSNEEFE